MPNSKFMGLKQLKCYQKITRSQSPTAVFCVFLIRSLNVSNSIAISQFMNNFAANLPLHAETISFAITTRGLPETKLKHPLEPLMEFYITSDAEK